MAGYASNRRARCLGGRSWTARSYKVPCQADIFVSALSYGLRRRGYSLSELIRCVLAELAYGGGCGGQGLDAGTDCDAVMRAAAEAAREACRVATG